MSVPGSASEPLSQPPEQVDSARVHLLADLPPQTRLAVSVQWQDSSGTPLRAATHLVMEASHPALEITLQPNPPLSTRVVGWMSQINGGFALALALYLLVRLIGLAQYPIYFFTDEAVQTLLAADFIRDGLTSYDGEFLPTYFKNVYQYNLGISVYLQIIPYLLFGKSVEVTRGVGVLLSLIAAISSGLTFSRVFKNPHAWLPVLVLSATPAWFLHSRTAFETSLAVSFYGAFLYAYLRYRAGEPRAIYAALIFAALSFYSYSPAQMVLVVTALLLLISDARYHWQQRRILARALLLSLVLALPYLRFQLAHPAESVNHLRQIGSYWLQPIPVWEKLSLFFLEYLNGLNPIYWFSAPVSVDLERHIMNGYGHLLRYLMPFGVLGVGIAIRHWRQSAYRALLLSALAAPAGAALVGLGITRALFMVIPAALLTALGISAVISWIARMPRFPRPAVVLAFVLLLVGLNVFLLTSALWHGPTWSTNYTLTGMQYGARQVFTAALAYAKSNPGAHLVLSPTWANGTDILARFFLKDNDPVELGSLEGYINEYRPFDAQTVFILPPDEFQLARNTSKFTNISVLNTLPYPNGEPGFYFVKMRYAEDAPAIFKAEEQERRALQTSVVSLALQDVIVRHSMLDIGEITHLFDANPQTMVRTRSANPLLLQLEFHTPRELNALVFRVGSTATTFEVAAQVAGEDKPRVWLEELPESTVIRTWELSLNQPILVNWLFIKVKNTRDPEPGHVHLWELTLK